MIYIIPGRFSFAYPCYMKSMSIGKDNPGRTEEANHVVLSGKSKGGRERRKQGSATAAVMLGIFFLLVAGESYALRCGSNLVLEGERKIEVLKECGEPDLIEKWETETAVYVTDRIDSIIDDLIINRGTRLTNSDTQRIEEWTYNFGPTRFIQFLTFENGKLKKIEDGSRGFSGKILTGSYKSECGLPVERGDRKIEVIMKCGDPFAVEYFWEDQYSTVSSAERIRKIPQFYREREGRKYRRDYKIIREKIHHQRRTLVNIEEWIYNFGPRRFLYFIAFENGKVTRVERGGYGY